MLDKVFLAGADAVVLDLEDAVVLARKQQAREMVAARLKSRQQRVGPSVYVRINSVCSGLWRDDLDAVVTSCLQGIRLPKADSAADINAVAEALTEAERTAGVPVGSISIVPTVETAAGVLAAAEMARMPRVEAFCFGASDFLRDIGAEPDPSGLQTLYAQSHLVLVSRSTGLQPPIAPVHTQLTDLDGLRSSSLASRRLGFFGRSCIHPAQIPIIHEVFSPSPGELAEAKRILAAFERASANGSASLLENGQFVDRAVAGRARDVLELAARGSGGPTETK